jgi:phosphatidylglycerophosphatase C
VSGKKIAFFDFDGTITTKDTLLELIKFQKGRRSFYIGFLINSPWLIAYKLKWIPNDRAKQKILSWFFAGLPLPAFQEKCDLFAEHELPLLIRPGAIAEISRLQNGGFEVVVVSASAANWISKWTNSHSLKLVATVLEVKNGLLTGRIQGKNCYGEQKVVCIRKQWDLTGYEEIFAYGDTPGDKPMLSLATKSFYKPFRTA